MNCPDADRAMVFSFYADLDKEAQRSLEAHCHGCAACARKLEEMKTELGEITRLSGTPPEFDWDKSWRAIRQGLAGRARARSRRTFLYHRLLPAAGLGIFVLGIIIGRQVFETPSRDLTMQPVDGKIMARLFEEHLGEAEIALREVANSEAQESGRMVLAFEKETTRSLGFRNRIMRTMARTSGDPALSLLLNDLEIILYEAANLDPGSPEAVERVKGLIREKEIFFRIRHWKTPRDPILGGKETSS